MTTEEFLATDSGKRLLEEHVSEVRSWEAKWLQEKMDAKATQEELIRQQCVMVDQRRREEIARLDAERDAHNLRETLGSRDAELAALRQRVEELTKCAACGTALDSAYCALCS